MNNIKVLDVTLRDGGCVNDFNFGTNYMNQILSAQEQAGIDIIELGYIDDKNGSTSGRTKYINERIISNCILHDKKPNITYVAMIDYGKYNFDNLEKFKTNGIDGIRLAFHKKDVKNIVGVGKRIISLGYKLYIQPMITCRYTDLELLELIDIVNSELKDASAFYIVDSFGEMRPNDLERVLGIVDHNLIAGMPIGLHSHNNLQMSYSNACKILEYKTERTCILDSSIMGMGKGAGNLNTELLIEHLNIFYNKAYNISPLLEVIDKVINQLYDEYKWGYSVEYYLSSINHCSPTYAGYFYNKHMLSIEKVNRLLACMDDEKKISFDKEYADRIYRDFNKENNVNDSAVFRILQEDFCGKKVLLVAPGKSLIQYEEKLDDFFGDDSYITIALNSTLDLPFDYYLITRKDIYDYDLGKDKRIIVPSNIENNINRNVYIINYEDWIDVDDGVHDSSGVMSLKLLIACGVREIYLVGFDGFSVDINENYYDPNLRHPVSKEQQLLRNHYYKNFLKKIQDGGVKIHFVTSSIYETI